MSIELKVKSKHLSEESKIIRFEEKKELRKSRNRIQYLKDVGHNDPSSDVMTLQSMYRSLRDHRVKDVRNEARATFLARAYLDGVEYKSVEQKRKNEDLFRHVVLPRVVTMINKYSTNGEKITKDDLICWSSLT